MTATGTASSPAVEEPQEPESLTTAKQPSLSSRLLLLGAAGCCARPFPPPLPPTPASASPEKGRRLIMAPAVQKSPGYRWRRSRGAWRAGELLRDSARPKSGLLVEEEGQDRRGGGPDRQRTKQHGSGRGEGGQKTQGRRRGERRRAGKRSPTAPPRARCPAAANCSVGPPPLPVHMWHAVRALAGRERRRCQPPGSKYRSSIRHAAVSSFPLRHIRPPVGKGRCSLSPLIYEA